MNAPIPKNPTKFTKPVMNSQELETYRLKNFFNYKPEFDVELKALRLKEAVERMDRIAAENQKAIKRAKNEAAQRRNAANKLARAAENQRLKDVRNSNRKG